jgi:hypothetical protein
MEATEMKDIISASRRTDLPRWYLDDTIAAFTAGSITLVNTFNNKPYVVNLTHENVHSIVWWSKDYSEFLKRADFFADWNNYFQFTINGYTDKNVQRLLEPGVASSLGERIGQMRQLADKFSPEQITWRFDPVVHWTEGEGDDTMDYNNLGDFIDISNAVGEIGVKRCVASFAEIYGKVVTRAKRAKSRFGEKVTFYDIGDELKRHKAMELAVINKTMNDITTYSCANNDIVDNEWIFPSHCVDGELLERLFGGSVSNVKDSGQREACGCVKSRDIGKYDQKCRHGCLYCYARPD